MTSMSSDLLGKVSQGCLLGANFAFIVAFASNAWMKYIDPTPELTSIAVDYGLWEQCNCRPVYALSRFAYSFSSAEGFPGWFTASQMLATFAMVTIFSALFLGCLRQYGSHSTKCAHIVLLCLVVVTGLFLLAAVVTFGVGLPKDKYFKEDNDNLDIIPDWGMGCAGVSLLCTLIAAIFLFVQLIPSCNPVGNPTV